jgi:hypothetical protein
VKEADNGEEETAATYESESEMSEYNSKFDEDWL